MHDGGSRLERWRVVIVIGVDPGPVESAYVEFDGRAVIIHDIVMNANLRHLLSDPLESWLYESGRPTAAVVVFEQVESFGMVVGREVFDTVFETGRMFGAAAGFRRELMTRRTVKLHLCGSSRAKDPNVRAALLDRFGGSKSVAQGTKKAPGPLYGIRSHEWSALALAVTWYDQHEEGHV